MEVHPEWGSTTANSEFNQTGLKFCKVQIQMPFDTHHTEDQCLHVAEQKHRHMLEQPGTAQISCFNYLNNYVSYS